MIPDFQSIMLPLLKIAGDKKEHTLQEIRESLADYFQLTDEDKGFYLRPGTLYLVIELDGLEKINGVRSQHLTYR